MINRTGENMATIIVVQTFDWQKAVQTIIIFHLGIKKDFRSEV